MRIALLSPYHGGSHRAWARGWMSRTRHEIELLGLPARFWKWRMHGAAVTLAERWQEVGEVDRIVATDMLDLAAFLGLTARRTAGIPVLLYMHENQITYPLPEEPGAGAMRRQHGERDRHYGFVNFTSMLAATRVAFNSEFHRDELLGSGRAGGRRGALARFLRHYPDHRQTGEVAAIAERSVVLPVGVQLDDLAPPDPDRRPGEPPLIVWNQRWEYDKNPGELMRVLVRLAGAGVRFQVALCGEAFGRRPPAMERGIAALGDRVAHAGHLPRAQYTELLGRSTIVVSTALHEFFGIGVVEAICAGAMPVLPGRLAYPEIVPERFHARCLYGGPEQLQERLEAALATPAETAAIGAELALELRARFAWPALAPLYDRAVETMTVA